MAGKIEQLTGITIDTGEKLYRDSTMNAGTIGPFDCGIAWSGGKKNVVVGSQIKSLSYENSVDVFAKAHTYAGGGMLWAGAAGSQFQLPAVAVPALTDKDWMYTIWLKISQLGNTSTNNNLMLIGTGRTTLADKICELRPVAAAGDLTSLSRTEISVLGVTVLPAAVLNGVMGGAVHQIAIRCKVADDSATFRVYAYLDQVQVYMSAAQTYPATPPSTPTQRYVGTDGGYVAAFTGAFYRARLDILSNIVLTPEEVLAADYALCHPRFS